MNLWTCQVNQSFRDQFLLGLAVAFWLVFFLIFIAPFDVADLTWEAKLLLIPPYGLFLFISYLVAFFIQRQLSFRWKWNILLEFFIILFTCILGFFLTYFYYISPVMNGTFSLGIFIRVVYIPIAILISSLLFFGRLFIARRIPQAKRLSTERVTLSGTNKNDQLKVAPNQIVCISSAHNYVEVFYKQNDRLEKHLIRGSLTQISAKLDLLVQVHRSHLVNPNYIVKWKDRNTIVVDEKEIPVSKTYKSSIEDLLS